MPIVLWLSKPRGRKHDRRWCDHLWCDHPSGVIIPVMWSWAIGCQHPCDVNPAEAMKSIYHEAVKENTIRETCGVIVHPLQGDDDIDGNDERRQRRRRTTATTNDGKRRRPRRRRGRQRHDDNDDNDDDNDDDTHPPRIIVRVGMIFRRGQKQGQHYDGPFTGNVKNALWKAVPHVRLIPWNERNLSGASKQSATIAYIPVATSKLSKSLF